MRRIVIQVVAVLSLIVPFAFVHSGSIAAAASCSIWATKSTVHPVRNNQPGTDFSVTLGLQERRCTFGPDVVWRYRAMMTNHYASGKTDVAVGLKHNLPNEYMCLVRCEALSGIATVDGVWHPRIPAGETWYSPEYVMASRNWVFADTHISYPRDNFYGITDLAIRVP